MRTTVLGGGAWGTALASHAARAGLPVRMWIREPEVAAAVNETRENPVYLPGVELPEGIRATQRLDEALADAEAVLVVVPSEFCRAVYRQAARSRPGRRRLRLRDEGPGDRHAAAHERGRGGGGPGPPAGGPLRALVRPRGGEGPADRRGGGLGRPRGGGEGAAAARHPRLPRLLERGRGRRRARRRAQERHRDRRRDHRRPRLRTQHRGGPHHPRPGRDRAARGRARGEAGHPRGPGRARRPGAHVHGRPVAQPDGGPAPRARPPPGRGGRRHAPRGGPHDARRLRPGRAPAASRCRSPGR